jgi:hypothetical protein
MITTQNKTLKLKLIKKNDTTEGRCTCCLHIANFSVADVTLNRRAAVELQKEQNNMN